jgi:hypothetical protein
MKASQKTQEIIRCAAFRGVSLSFDDANTLRRAELTLRRWAEELFNGTIQRLDDGKTYRYHGAGTPGPFFTTRAPDRESGALRRVSALCKRLKLHFYYQTDPRGCALYVSAQPLTHQNYYSVGVECSS